MKKVLIVGLMVGLLSSVGYAEEGYYPSPGFIEKHVDSFNGSTRIMSKVPYEGPEHLGLGIFRFVVFQKIITSSRVSKYSLMLSRIDKEEWWFFERTSLEMKIGKKIYYLSILGTDSKILGDEDPLMGTLDILRKSHLFTGGIWKIDKEMIRKILEADSITVRVHYSQHPPTTWTIPLEMLNEWKQVVKQGF